MFLIDLRDLVGNGITINPIRTMINHATTEVLFDNLRIPAASLIGQPDRPGGQGLSLYPVGDEF